MSEGNMADAGEREAEALVAGFTYPSFEVTVTPEDQAEKHRLCGVDTRLFGDYADITYFANQAILATKRAGITINGSVHMTQRYRLMEPIMVGEKLEQRGEITSTEDTPKGRIVRSTFTYVRPDGSVPMVAERSSIRLDLGTGEKPAAKESSAPKAAEPLPEHELSVVQFVPEHVAAYSAEADNRIHSHPEVARQFGFRAPIAGGLMASRLMMEALYRKGPVRSLEMEIRFLRPMFWDDRLRVVGNADLTALAVVGPHGKPTSRAVVESISYLR